MKITKIYIQNYRLLKDVSIDLEDNLSLIVGKNNTGKTSFISLLKEFLSNSSNNFSFDDFNLEFQNEIIELLQNQVAEIEKYTEPKILLKLEIEYNENDSLANLSEFFIDLDENNNKIYLQFEYVLTFEKYVVMLENYTEYKSKLSNNNENDFLKKYFSNYFKIIKKSIDINDIKNELIINDISKIIDIEYIKAERKVVSNDLSGNINKTLTHLANKYFSQMNSLGEFDISALTNELYNTDINLTPIYNDTFKELIETVKMFSNDNKIKVISNISNNKNIIQDNSDVVYEVDNKMLPEDYNGLGYMNLLSILFQIHIALDKLKSINGVSKKADINLLFIEEPEVHTHPQMQYIFIKNIKTLIEKYKLEMNIQTIITTHSAHIVSQSDFNDIKYFKKNLNEEIEIKSLKKLSDLYTDEQDAFYFLKQYLTLNKAELFFADKVIFIEGDTERLLLPAMMKKIDDEKKEDIKYIPLLSQNISFVEVGAYSHVFAKMIQFLGIKTLIITDIDSVKEVFKNGRQIRIACEVCNGKYSSNASIKCFLKTDDLNAIKQSQQNILKIEEKTCVDGIRMLTFVNDDNGKLNIVYQKEIENYYPRSFEDAFFIENKQFIKNHIKEFDSSLKKINQNVQNMNPYKFSNCIIRKTSFALDILYISLKNLSEWNIPQYIKGGLEWLAKN